MVNHPRRSKLAAYGGRIIAVDDRRTVELVGANDNAKRLFQYRATVDGDGIERRVLRENGQEPKSPRWALCAARITQILDPPGF